MSYYGIPWLDRFLGTPLESRALAVFKQRQKIEQAAYDMEDRLSMPYAQAGPADAGEKARREGERLAAEKQLAEMQAELTALSQGLEDDYVAYRQEQAYAPDWQAMSKGLSDLDEYVIDEQLSKALESGDIEGALELIKGAGHKYIRRIPTGDPKRKWIYIYNVTSKHHGKGPQVGEKIKVSHGDKRGHYEVTHAHDDDHVTLRHDESGHEMKVHKDHVHEIFAQEHEDAVDAAHKRLARTVEMAMRHGTKTQQAKAQAALDEHREKYGYGKERKDEILPERDMIKLPSGRQISRKDWEAEQAQKRAEVSADAIAELRADIAEHLLKVGGEKGIKEGWELHPVTLRQALGYRHVTLDAGLEALERTGHVKKDKDGAIRLTAKGAKWANSGGDSYDDPTGHPEGKAPAKEKEPEKTPAQEEGETLQAEIDRLGEKETKLFEQARAAQGTDKHKALYEEAVATLAKRAELSKQKSKMGIKAEGPEWARQKAPLKGYEIAQIEQWIEKIDNHPLMQGSHLQTVARNLRGSMREVKESKLFRPPPRGPGGAEQQPRPDYEAIRALAHQLIRDGGARLEKVDKEGHAAGMIPEHAATAFDNLRHGKLDGMDYFATTAALQFGRKDLQALVQYYADKAEAGDGDANKLLYRYMQAQNLQAGKLAPGSALRAEMRDYAKKGIRDFAELPDGADNDDTPYVLKDARAFVEKQKAAKAAEKPPAEDMSKYEVAAPFYSGDGKEHSWPEIPGWESEAENRSALGDVTKMAYQMAGDKPPFRYVNFDGDGITLKNPKPGKWHYEIAGERVEGEFNSESEIPGLLKRLEGEIREKTREHLAAASSKLGGDGWELMQSGEDLSVASDLTDDHHVVISTPDGVELGAGKKVDVTAELLDTGGYETDHMLREETSVSTPEEMQRFADKFREKAKKHLQSKGHLDAEAAPPPPEPAPPAAGGPERGTAHEHLGGEGKTAHPQEKRIKGAGKYVRRDASEKLRLPSLSTFAEPIEIEGPGGSKWASDGHFMVRQDLLDEATHKAATTDPRKLGSEALKKVLANVDTSIAYHYTGIGAGPETSKTTRRRGVGEAGDQSRVMLYRSADGKHSVLVNASYSPPTTLYGGPDAGDEASAALVDSTGEPSYAVMPLKSPRAQRNAMHYHATTGGAPLPARNIEDIPSYSGHVVIDGVTHEIGDEKGYYHAKEGFRKTGEHELHGPDGSEKLMRDADGGGIEVSEDGGQTWAKKDVRAKSITIATPLDEIKPAKERTIKAPKGEGERAADHHKYMTARLHNEKGEASLGTLTSKWKDTTHRVEEGGKAYYTNGHMIISEKHLKPSQKKKLDEYHDNKAPHSRFSGGGPSYDNLQQVGGGEFPIEYHYVGPHSDDTAEATLGGKPKSRRMVYRSPDGHHVAVVDGEYSPPRVLHGKGNEGGGKNQSPTLSPLVASYASPLDYVVMPVRDNENIEEARAMADKLHKEGHALRKSLVGLAALDDYLSGDTPEPETLDALEKAEMNIEQQSLPFAKADDGKPGESLAETSTDELEQTHADIQHRLKGGKDPGLQARAQAIAGELAKRKGGEKMAKGLDGLQDYLIKAGELMPTKDPNGLPKHDEKKLGHGKSSSVGASADGGDLDGVGMTSGSGDSAPAPGTGKDGVPTGTSTKKEKWSEDDAEESKQMSDHKKALESRLTRKSLTPADIRSTVEHEHARKVSELRKGEPDVSVGGTVHPYSHEAVHGNTDAAVERLCKSEFYFGPPPQLAPPDSVLRKSVLCKSEACGQRFAAALTACPHCGEDTVQSRMLPTGGHLGASGGRAVILEKSAEPLLRPPPQEPDLYIPGNK